MALTPGTRLGPYEILSALGAGGMGEVYRARDTKLNRDVAIKVLPDLFVADPDRVARFTREAQTLASLNHPNIGSIHGLEESGGVTALVMELVEGEDLSQRLARGAIPIDEALPIAKQIADALEAAHEQGVIHRDLKPANIKVRPDGTVKVLDFGLAKAMEDVGRVLPSGAAGAAGSKEQDPAYVLSQSPTITSPAMMTDIGIILGTAAYMSPEQARGKPVDKRADIWAFGVVLFEMLTGERLFTGETISDTLASVLKTDPDWRTLPADVPLRLRRLLRVCLQKDPKRRLQAIGDARVQIEEVLAGTPEETVAAAIAETTPLWRRVLPWASTGALAAGLAAVILLWAPWRGTLPASASLRLSAELGADVTLAVGSGDAMSLSPDGAVLAFVGQKGAAGRPQLYVRRLTQTQALPLPGTDNAESPFFSPDGQWIGFFAGGKLKKISVTGGATITLCDAPNGRGGTWSEDHRTIVFSPNNTPGTRLMRVSSDGGTPELLISPPEREAPQAAVLSGLERWPQLLPGGKAVLFTSRGDFVDANIVVQPLPTGARTVVHAGSRGRYLPSGHLLYLHDGTLFAVPFDLDRLAVTGPSVPAIEGVTSNAGTGGAQLTVSASGALAYLPGQSTGIGIPIHWMDHGGKATQLRVTPASWNNILFAPDGQRLALQVNDGGRDIWVFEWAQDRLTLLTSDPAADIKPVWSPDGRRIVFASDRANPSTLNLHWQRTGGTAAQRLTESKNPQEPASWHPSGAFLAFTELNPATNMDLMILPMEGDEASGWKPGTPTVFLNTAAQEREPMFSPDGRWLAYASNEAGRDEVYVRPFRGPGGRQLISTGGGVMPTWSRTKKELFYVINGEIMVAPYAVEADSFRAEKPRRWSDGPLSLVSGSGAVRMFDLHPDGKRIAFGPLRQTPVGAAPDHFTIITNFFDELRRIAPRSP